MSSRQSNMKYGGSLMQPKSTGLNHSFKHADHIQVQIIYCQDGAIYRPVWNAVLMHKISVKNLGAFRALQQKSRSILVYFRTWCPRWGLETSQVHRSFLEFFSLNPLLAGMSPSAVSKKDPSIPKLDDFKTRWNKHMKSKKSVPILENELRQRSIEEVCLFPL